MKTTKQLADEHFEELYNRERAYLDAERQHWEMLVMEAIQREDEKLAGPYAKVLLGKVRKRHKFEGYAKVTTTKLPRFLKHIQHK